ncbi:MAG TPA: hypothetical protein VME40_18160 [Caulobacteraceae bacterium]|nr:hypothetical protein [Caulobacteraceae bacterium]
MTEDRFRALAEAYGADLRGWPPAERDAAQTFTEANRDLAGAILETERSLEAQLEAYIVEPSPALRQRVIDIAPRARAIARTWRWLATLGLGLGLAASAVAGAAAGFSFAPASVTRLIEGPPASSSDDIGMLADPTDDLVNG